MFWSGDQGVHGGASHTTELHELLLEVPVWQIKGPRLKASGSHSGSQIPRPTIVEGVLRVQGVRAEAIIQGKKILALGSNKRLGPRLAHD